MVLAALRKMENIAAFKSIDVRAAVNNFKAKDERLNYGIKFGMNMFMANRRLLNWAISMVDPDSGFLNN